MLLPIPQGVVFSSARHRWEFVCCKCKRIQGYALDTEHGGITEDEAVTLGWRQVKSKWVCPFCTGNLNNLKKVFDGDSE